MNERLGHPVGDKVLRVVADTIHGAVEGKGEVYRVGGGGEILLGLGREITLSVGAAMFPAAGKDKDSLLKAADDAQRAVKVGGGDSVQFA